MSLYRFRPGETAREIPGRTWNALVEGEERDRAKGRANIRGPQGGEEGDNPGPSRVLVRNNTSEEVPTGGVLRLVGVQFEPAVEPGCEYAGPLFTTETPAADNQDQHVAIAFEPIAPDCIGWATIPNACWAKVNVSDAGHTHAKVKASVAELESGTSGYPIIWKETGTGAGKWAVVKIGGGGSGSTTLTSGYLVNEIPAEDMLALCIKRDEWDPDVNWYTIEDEPSLGGINKTGTPIRGSEAVPIAVWGFVRSVTTTEDDIEVTREYLEIVHYDMASLPGHENIPSGAKPQGPYHPSGSRAYRVDGGPCNTD